MPIPSDGSEDGPSTAPPVPDPVPGPAAGLPEAPPAPDVPPVDLVGAGPTADLSAAERALRAAFPRGEMVDVRPLAAEAGAATVPGEGDDVAGRDRTDAPGDDAASEHADRREDIHDAAAFDGWETWDPSRVVRASVLAELLLGEPAAAPGRVPALRLRGAKITGRLDLSHGRVSVPIVLRQCAFASAPVLAGAGTGTVEVSGSLLPGLAAPGIRTDGAMVLAGNRFTGPVTLADARIDGSLSLARSGFTRAPGGRMALDIHRAHVAGNLDGPEITVDGETGMNNARVGGLMRLSGARLREPGGLALAAGGLAVEGGVFCMHGFAAAGQLRLVGAKLGANLTFANATLHNPGGIALLLDQAVIRTLEGHRGFRCTGEIRMVGAQVSGRVNLSEAELDGSGTGNALTADAVHVGDAVLLNRIRAGGSLRLRMTRITGRLHLTGARIDNPGGYALRASRSEIGSDVFATDMTVTGQVRFAGAHIGGRFELAGAALSNPGDVALSANQMIAGRLDLLPGSGLGSSSSGRGTTVDGLVDLRHARIGVLRDDPAAWSPRARTEQARTEQTRSGLARFRRARAEPAQFQLDGLTYQALEPRLPARERLRWLAADAAGYQPQPYEQLAAEYNRIGQYTDARRVLYAKERRSRAGLTRFGRVWNLLQDVTVAYGYQPWRAAVWLVVLLVIGSTLYGRYPPPPLRPGEAPRFNPVSYTLDLMLPLVDLGQERGYDPAGVLQWVSYLFVAAGFLLATTIAAGVARVLSRN